MEADQLNNNSEGFSFFKQKVQPVNFLYWGTKGNDSLLWRIVKNWDYLGVPQSDRNDRTQSVSNWKKCSLNLESQVLEWQHRHDKGLHTTHRALLFEGSYEVRKVHQTHEITDRKVLWGRHKGRKRWAKEELVLSPKRGNSNMRWSQDYKLTFDTSFMLFFHLSQLKFWILKG